MKITFDPAKDAANFAKHGVSLALAAQMEWGTALAWPDARREYGETRMSALVLLGTRLFCTIYVDRDGARRIISLRKANDREVRRYAEND